MQGTGREALNRILEAARWGVSADNGQPWKFCWRESQLSVSLDSMRACSFFDRQQFAAYLGLGSVIENLCIAARHIGYEPDLKVFTERVNGEQIETSISFKASAPEASPLFPAIFERTTNRRPYTSAGIPSEVISALRNSGDNFNSFKLKFVDERDLKRQLATMTAEAETVRFHFSRKEVHRDFFSSLRFTKRQARESGDGLWLPTLQAGLAGSLALRLLANWPVAAMARHLGAQRAFSQQSIFLLRRTPTVALVISSSAHSAPDKRNFLVGGQLCQRLWLTATAHGVACQPMAILPLFFAQYACLGEEGFPQRTAPKIARIRGAFRRAFDLKEDDHLVMLFRLGYAKPPSARSFRRPLSDLLTLSDDSVLARG
jgi:nitroreductase